MKIKQVHSPEELNKITKEEYYKIYYLRALSDRQIAKMYGVKTKDARDKRKELKLNLLNCAFLYLAGGPKYKRK